MKKYSKDKPFIKIKSLLPKTFRSHIIISYLILAFGPFLFISIYLYTSAQETIKNTSADVEAEIVDYVVRLYQDHLNKQALLIETKLDEARNSVLLARETTEKIFMNKEKYPSLEPIKLINEAEGYSWEKTSMNVSNVGISAISKKDRQLMEILSRSKYLEPLFKNVVTYNPHVAAMYFISPESAWRMYPRMNVKYEIESGFLKPDIDLTKQPFYSYAVKEIEENKKEVLLTDTYQDLTHRNKVFTLSTPIYIDGKVNGIIGADITIKQVMKHILNFQFKEKDAYALLISKSLNFIAYQDDAKKDINFYNHDIRKKLFYSESPNVHTIEGEEKIFLYAPIKNVQWQLIYVIPKKDVLFSITDITDNHIQANKEVFSFQFLSILIVLILFLVFSLIMFIKYFMTPLGNLLSGISSVSQGKFDTRIQVDYLQEFKDLAEAFNDMSNKVSTLLNDYKNLNTSLERKVEERTKQLILTNESLQETNQTLRKIENSRRELFSNIAHDLKTPITLVQGYLEAIKDGMVTEDKIDDYLDRMFRHLTSINRLAKDLYELSTVEMKNSSTFDFQVVDTYSYFHKILTNYQSSVRIVVDIPKNLPKLKVDKEYMKRALYNLIENSIKYSEEHYPVYVTINKSKDQMVHIAITDLGVGIPEEDLPHIFDRFYRADKSRNSTKPGNGLGLAIVLEIVKGHGGKIEVDSTLGKGSTFTIILPAKN